MWLALVTEGNLWCSLVCSRVLWVTCVVSVFVFLLVLCTCQFLLCSRVWCYVCCESSWCGVFGYFLLWFTFLCIIIIVCSALFVSSCCQVLSPVSCSPPGLFAVLILLSVTFCSYFCISACSLIPNKVLHFVHFCHLLCLHLAPAAPVLENYLWPYIVYKRWT